MPASSGSSSVWRCASDRLGPGGSAALAFALATALALCVFPQAAPVHSDTARDLVIARECVSGAACPGAGPPTSFGGLLQGALWSHLLELRWHLGLSLAAFESCLRWSVVLASAIVPALSRGVRTPVAGALTWLVWLKLTNASSERPLLWNLTPAPLLLVLAWWGLLRAVERRSLFAYACSVAALAAACDCHLVFALLVPLVALTAAITLPVPWLVAPLAVAAPLAFHFVDSPGAWRANVAIAHPWLPLLALAAVTGLGVAVALRRRLARHVSPARAALALVLAYGLGLGLLALVSGHWLEARYFAPVATPVALLAGPWLGARLTALGTRWPRATPPRVAGLLVAWLVIDSWVTSWVLGRRIDYRVADVEPVAAALGRAGFTFEELLLGARAYRANQLVGSVGAFDPDLALRPAHDERAVLVVRLPRSAWPEAPGQSVPLAGGARAVVIPYAPALLAAEVRACAVRPGAQAHCFDAALRDGSLTSREPGRWAARGYPGYRALFDGFGRDLDGARLRIRLRLELAAGETRAIHALRDREGLSWTIDAVEGAAAPPALPTTSFTLSGPASGHVWFATELRGAWQYGGALPAFVELTPELLPALSWLQD